MAPLMPQKCAAILLASPPVRSSSATSTPSSTGAGAGPAGTPAPTPAPTPSPQAIAESAAPTPAPAPSTAGPTSAPTPPPANTGGNGNNGDSGINANSTPVNNDEDDGEDLPYCDELEGGDEASTAIDADDSAGEGGMVQVQSMTSTETITIPATAYVSTHPPSCMTGIQADVIDSNADRDYHPDSHFYFHVHHHLHLDFDDHHDRDKDRDKDGNSQQLPTIIRSRCRRTSTSTRAYRKLDPRPCSRPSTCCRTSPSTSGRSCSFFPRFPRSRGRRSAYLFSFSLYFDRSRLGIQAHWS